MYVQTLAACTYKSFVLVSDVSSHYVSKVYLICRCMHTLLCRSEYTPYYTPGIYAAGYIVFALTFVRSSVHMFVCSLVRSFVCSLVRYFPSRS